MGGCRLFQVIEDQVVDDVPLNPFIEKHLSWIKSTDPMLGTGSGDAILLTFGKPQKAFSFLWNKEQEEIAAILRESP